MTDLERGMRELLRPLVEEVVRSELEHHRPEPKRWLTLREAAARLDCTPDAVRMRVRRGWLEHRYQGRRLYVSADSVDRL